MTDQRPIDPSTLRGGEYVRADGDGWAVEGRVTFVLGDPCVDLGNYCQGIKRAVITRLPAAPEPAPVEVGDWWKSATGIVGVVLGVDGDTLTWRRLDGSLPLAGRTHVMAESWTRLDGPPEPAVGKVYVLTSFVCENIAGHHYRMGISGCHPWSEFLRCFTRQELATLQIVHTLGVE